MKSLWAGLMAGALATVSMTGVMQLLHHFPYPEPHALPPQQITQNAAAGVGLLQHLDEKHLQAIALANHLGFGAVAGALYALTLAKAPGRFMAKGTGWGLMVWAVSYLGWLPATHLLPPATQHSKRRTFLMVSAHLVWGIATALFVERMAKEDAP